jgi:hypothetical protein
MVPVNSLSQIKHKQSALCSREWGEEVREVVIHYSTAVHK